MTGIQSVILQASDPAAAEEFYVTAFGLGDRLLVHAADAPTSGFRGFMLSLVVAQPNIVDTLIDAATHGGATTLKPAEKSFWGTAASCRHRTAQSGRSRRLRRRTPAPRPARSTTSCCCWELPTSRQPSSSTSPTACPSPKASAASTSSSARPDRR